MKHLYIYLDKTNGLIRKLWLMAAFLLCSLQINAQCPSGMVVLKSQLEVEAFAMQYPNCTKISGDLFILSNVSNLSPLQKIVTIDGDFNINGTTLSKLDGLSSLKNIGGSLVANSSYVENFSGLSSLTSIGGNLNVQNNSRLTSFSGLSTLTTIGGSLLANSSNMSNFNGLSSLATIGGDLNVGNSMLNTFTGLSSLTSIGGNINTRSTTELQNFEGLSSLKNIAGMFLLESSHITTFAGLSSLTTIGGGLHLLGNSQIKNVDGLNSLTSIGGAFWIEGSGQLTNLNALSSLKTIGGKLQINANPTLENVNFSALSTIGGEFRIQGNQNLKSLQTLTSLTNVTRDLYIDSNPNLTDISGLKNLDPTKITNLSINANTKLAVCNNAFVCNYLQGSGYRVIFNNATGCEDANTVIASCVPVCEVPANITSSGVIFNKATINWTNTGTFDLEWGITGFKENSQQSLGTASVSALNYQITELSPNTKYDVYVRKNCTINESEWVKHSFTTRVVCPTNLFLYSQTDVNNFANYYPGCTQVSGELEIIGGSSITDLSPLSNLQIIGNRAIIQGNTNLTSLNGLDAVTKIGGLLSIRNNTKLTNLNALSSLTSISGTLTISGNTLLTDISGVKKITPSGVTTLTILNNPQLAVCNNTLVCTFSGTKSISGNAVGCQDVSTVTASCIPACEVPADIVSSNIISNKAKISWTSTGSAFDMEWGEVGFTQGTGTVQNGVSANNFTITGLTESTSYDVYVRQNCTADQSDWVKHTFSTISVCPAGDIFLRSQGEVENFGAMYPNCTQTKGYLYLQNNITDLSPLSKLQSIGTHIGIDKTQLTNLNGLSSLTSINGGIEITSNSKLEDISGLKNINSGIINLLIYDNLKLSVCNIASVCNYLQTSESRQISENATGCQNEETIIASCTPACEVPANVTSSNIISNKAKISWTSTGSAFDLEWGDEGFMQGTGTVQNGVSATNYTITGLTESTSYDVYVRQNCTADQSDWVKYTFSTISVCPAGNIVLGSQGEVDDFGAMYPNCTQTEGYLLLQYDITDLSPLRKLQSIGTHLGIYQTQLTNLNGLSSLTSINGGIEISSNFELEDISGLKNINSGIINLNILANLKLSVCNIASVCNYLQTSGNRIIEENATGCEDENAVIASCTTACEIPAGLTSSNIISNKAKISWTSTGSAFDLEWGDEGFTQGTGTVQNGVSATNYTITGLTESTSYDVYVRQNCTADQSDWVKYTFSTITTCPDNSLQILGSQEEVDNFGAKYPNCTHIEGLFVVGKIIYASGEITDITDITALSNIQSFEKTLTIDGTLLTNLDSLSSLSSVGALYINNNPKLSNIEGLSSVTSLGGLIINTNDVLTNLNGLNNIQNFQGRIGIGGSNSYGVPAGNAILTDISALQNINPDHITDLYIRNNPSLSVCHIASVCGYLQGWGYKVISGNALGCQDINTIIAHCTATLSTSDINKKGVMVYPNPFTDVINLSDINNIQSVTVNDISGKLIKTIKPTREINFSDNASGVYIINVKFKDGDVKSFKVIKK